MGFVTGFDFDAAVTAPHRMQPGLRRLAPGRSPLTPTVTPDGQALPHLQAKLQAWSREGSRLAQSAPGANPAPALQALSRWAAAEHPHAWRCDELPSPDGVHHAAPALGWGLEAQGRVRPLHPHRAPEVGCLLQACAPPQRLAALLSLAFAEDLALIDAATAQVPWMAVALPSFWAPGDKVGLSLAEVHAPVADGELLRRAAPALAALVSGPHRHERFVWTLTDHPHLDAHPGRVSAERWPEPLRQADRQTLVRHTWLRTERQCFLPVPGRAQALFTIGVEARPLQQVLAVPGRAAALHRALTSMSPAVRAYRHLDAAADPLLAALAWQAGRECGTDPDPSATVEGACPPGDR